METPSNLNRGTLPFSRIMLGTVQFGLSYGIANTRGVPSDKELADILKEAFDGGIDSLDTSADYGTSEERLGKTLARLGLSERFRIVTKIPAVPASCRGEPEIRLFFEEHLARSFRRLRVRHLDGVLLHAESDAAHLPILESILVRGYAEIAGVSLDSSAYPVQADRARCVQIPANLLDHRFDSLVETAPETNRTVFARSVFLQGLLLMPRDKVPASLAGILAYRDRLADLAGQAGRTLPEIALGYLYSQPNIASIVLGVETVGQLRENLETAARAVLPADLLTQLKNAVGLLPENLIRPMLWKQDNREP